MPSKIQVSSKEHGQVVVLLILLLVGLLGIAALAVDGGRLYYEKRTAQNAADNAALSAAFALCSSEDVSAAALTTANTNGFDNNGSSNSVAVHHPPSSGPNTGDPAYVEIVVNSLQKPAFAQIVYGGSFEVTARAVGHCGSLTVPPALGYGIVALDPDDSCSLNATGNGSLTVNAGSIFVNSNEDDAALCATGDAEMNAGNAIDVVGGWDTTGNAGFSPEPNTGASPLTDPLESLGGPPHPGGTCTTYSISGNSSDTIDPGLYCSISISTKGQLIMNPGIYYIEGGDVSISGNGILDASEVMFYLDGGDFSITGNGEFHVSAPTTGPFAGMVLFMDQENEGSIDITGGGTVEVTGTIYGALANMNLSGNGTGTVLNTQIIVNSINISGNGTLNLIYDPDELFQDGPLSAFVELAE